MTNLKTKKVINFAWLFVIILALYFLGCDKMPFFLHPKPPASQKQQEPAPLKIQGTLVAKINNLPISSEDLNDEIAAYNTELENSNLLVPEEKAKLKIVTREQKIDYVRNQMMRRTLLYLEALNRGIDKNPEIVHILEKTKEDLLVIDLVRQEVGNFTATPSEINDYFEKNKNQFREPEKRQIREIVISSEAEARDVLIQLLQGADFAALAKEHSKSASAKDGGDSGLLEKDNNKKSAQFNAVAFSDTLEAGKISNIFKAEDGNFYILKLEKKIEGKQQTLSDPALKDYIEKLITIQNQQKKIDDLVGKLYQNAKVEIYEGEIH